MIQYKSVRPLRQEDMTTKPPRVLLCHCQKCDERWTVRMTLVPDPEPAPKRSRGRMQKRMVWIFPPEGFDQCRECGAKNAKSFNDQKVISTILVRTNGVGQVKVHIPGALTPVITLEEDDLVQE